MPAPRKRRKKSRNYFTQETEDAIVLYNNTADPEVRSKIYDRDIHYAFFKLTENITSFIEEIKKIKPSSLKGNFVNSVYLSSSMGFGLRVEI